MFKFLTWQTVALWCFVAIVIVTNLTLLADLWLDLEGIETITVYCRAHPWAAAAILMVLQAGEVALGVHFMAPTPIKFGHPAPLEPMPWNRDI